MTREEGGNLTDHPKSVAGSTLHCESNSDIQNITEGNRKRKKLINYNWDCPEEDPTAQYLTDMHGTAYWLTACWLTAYWLTAYWLVTVRH